MTLNLPKPVAAYFTADKVRRRSRISMLHG